MWFFLFLKHLRTFSPLTQLLTVSTVFSTTSLHVISFFLIVVSFSLAYKSKEAMAGVKIVAINGKEIYKDKCTLCHGDNGKLGMSGAKDLSATQLTHAGILEIISTGKNGMASYKNILSQDQIEAVASYIETDLKGK